MKRTESSRCQRTTSWILCTANVFLFQMFVFVIYLQRQAGILDTDVRLGTPWASQQVRRHPVLDFPVGEAVALPSLRVNNDDSDSNRNSGNHPKDYYGGKGDKPHLGGFANNDIDLDGVSPATWKFMVEAHGIKSLLDVGCGRGVSTSWFQMHGVDVHCVEGSHDAWEQSLIPNKLRTEHDFARGPWWPSKTYDAVWCVELLEHVGRNYHNNLMPAMRQAALLYVTHSIWGGWHHVEVHSSEWWITKFQSFGFVYSESLTDQIKKVAQENMTDPTPNGKHYRAQHLWTNLKVFVNPAVASLPEHAHLLAEAGCTDGILPKGSRPCDPKRLESTLPPQFLPLELTPQMDAAWERHIFGNTTVVT